MEADASGSQTTAALPVLDYRAGEPDAVQIPKSSGAGIIAVVASLIVGSVAAIVFALGSIRSDRDWNFFIDIVIPIATVICAGVACASLTTRARLRHHRRSDNQAQA